MVWRYALALVALSAIGVNPASARERFDIAITVDDLPAHGPLPAGQTRAKIARAYLDALERHHVPEAFGFVNAQKLADDRDAQAVLTLWRKAGYPLGNHSFSHMNLGRAASLQAWEEDVIAGEPAVAAAMPGADWHWFRYPNLSTGKDAAQHAASLSFLTGRGYHIAEVSVAFSDWAYTDAYVRCRARGDDATIARMKVQYLQGVDDGIAWMKATSHRVYGRMVPQVLLTHIGAWSALMLPQVLARLDAAGAHYVTLAGAEHDPAYARAAAYPGGGGIMERTARAEGIDLSGVPSPKPIESLAEVCK
ncbi:polysaccharide deacetylase family protein [Novosphingobium sp. 9]|uniref:polysaccharide deacetylase family protein n=1 Tax=Novosphingobium sp. 9 TaxID=2025349 RepID=UPI0021B65B7C|nr:polysaccharide deacetylase family protein [Novosphingobium sp. 9]